MKPIVLAYFLILFSSLTITAFLVRTCTCTLYIHCVVYYLFVINVGEL